MRNTKANTSTQKKQKTTHWLNTKQNEAKQYKKNKQLDTQRTQKKLIGRHTNTTNTKNIAHNCDNIQAQSP